MISRCQDARYSSDFGCAKERWRISFRRALRAPVLGARVVVLFVALATTPVARGDYKEFYTVVGYEAGANHYSLPASGSGSVTSFAGAISLSTYYGLSNSLHIGGRVRVSASSDVHFSGATVSMPDGAGSTGDVYRDHRSVGLGALAVYRVDMGFRLAPVFELEGGFTTHQYRNIAHVPAGASFTVSLSNVAETVLHGSGSVLLEYRFRNGWILATGIGGQVEPNGLTPWSLFVPFRVGRIW